MLEQKPGQEVAILKMTQQVEPGLQAAAATASPSPSPQPPQQQTATLKAKHQGTDTGTYFCRHGQIFNLSTTLNSPNNLIMFVPGLLVVVPCGTDGGHHHGAQAV